MQLHLSPGGSKTWFLAFRFNGQQKKLRLGAYPALGLAEARVEREKAKATLDRGLDPIAHLKEETAKAQAVATASATTFRSVGEELLAKRAAEGISAETQDKRRWLLSFAIDEFGDQPIAAITPADVLFCLRKIEARGRLDTAGRVRALVSEVFRYGIASQQAATDPAAMLIGALTSPTVKNRAALTRPEQFGELLRAVAGYAGQPATQCALQLLAYTALRPGELRQGRWSELDFLSASWTVPAERMKGRKPHRIPLSRQAVEIFRELKALSRSDLMFQGNGKSRSIAQGFTPLPISENTLNMAIRRMGFSQDEMTAHGFRASFSTLCAESQLWSVDVVEAQLAHQDPNQIRRIYQRSTFWDERVKLAQWWSDECDRLRLLKPTRS